MSLDKANPSGSKRVGKEYVVSQETVASVDGTPIAYWRSGDGPPLILVHGSFDDHNVWAPHQLDTNPDTAPLREDVVHG
jgi:hypothetical protein